MWQPPGWIGRWGVSIASLIGGLLTLFVFRRGLPHVGWIVGYLILLWLLAGLVAEIRQPLASRRRRIIVTAADYTIQTLYHGLLLFVLPAYYASCTLSSANAAFLVLIGILAMLTTFDPWYRAAVRTRPAMRYVFFLVATFAALNVAIPLVGVPPFEALIASAGISVLALTPVIRRLRSVGWGRALGMTALAAPLVAGIAAFGRIAIPPAPLSLARAAIARDVSDGQPIAPISGVIGISQLHDWGTLVAYTAVYAPSGLSQPIAHVWRHDGRVVDVVSLSPVRGGRREGFRTYSRKTEFPRNPVGRWAVDVMTASGQLVGRVRFRVVR